MTFSRFGRKILCFLLLFSGFSVSARAETAHELSILKPLNLSSLKKYPASGTYARVLSTELKRYLSPIRGLSSAAQPLNRPLATNHFILYPQSVVADCRYILSGTASNPKIEIKLRVFAGPEGSLIFEKRILSSTDRSLFDSLDKLCSAAVQAVKNFMHPAPASSPSPKPRRTPTEPAQPRFGVLILSNFSIGDEQYELQINSNTIDATDPAYFYYSIPLSPDETHNVALYHLPDRREVLKIDWKVTPGEVKTLSYSARAQLILTPLKNPKHWESYTAYLNNSPVSNGEHTLEAGKTYRLLIVDSKSNTVWADTRHLADGETWNPQPGIDFKFQFHPKIYLSDGLYPGAGLDWVFHPWFWTGIGLGIQNFQINGSGCWVFYPQLEAGYWILGGQPNEISVGAGLTLLYPLGIPDPGLPTQPAYSHYYPGAGLFVDLRALVFYARPAFYYDWLRSTFQFQIQGGVRF